MKSSKLRDVIANALRVEPTSVDDNLRFGESPSWDSLNHVALMMALEAEFGVEISDDQMVELTDIRSIGAFVEANATPQSE